jgi:hypothetical protein
MPLYAISLLFSLEVQAPNAPEPLRELAIHVVSAADDNEAEARGRAIGKARETSYENVDGEVVRDIFKAVVEVRELMDHQLFDGMEVASWMFRRGEHLVIDESGTTIKTTEED